MRTCRSMPVAFWRLALPLLVAPLMLGLAPAHADPTPPPVPSVDPLPSTPPTAVPSAEPLPSVEPSATPTALPIPSVEPSALPTPSVPPSLPLTPLNYRIRTVYGALDKTTDAVLLVPTPVDVDGDPSTGTLGAEILAQLQIDAGRATVRVTKLDGAPAVLPLLVEAILADPRGGGSPLRVAFGYDALGSTAPAVYDATISLAGSGRVSSVTLDLHTAGAGDTLGVIGTVFQEGPNGERLDPQIGRVDYRPVPTVAHFGLLNGRDVGTQQSSLDLVTNVPTTVTVLIQNIQGAAESRVDAVIDKLPNSLSVVLTEVQQGATTTKTWSYSATDRIGVLSYRARDLDGGAPLKDFSLAFLDMPLSAQIVQDSPTHLTLQADSAIGAIEAGSAARGPIAWRDEPAYLYVTDRGGVDSFAFRLLGLSRAEFDSGDPLLVDVTLTPGPFHVLVEAGTRVTDGWIRDLPSQVRVGFSQSSNTMDWNGSAPIGEISVDVRDPAGVSGRATAMVFRLLDLPASLSVTWSGAGGETRLDAKGGRIGLATLLLTSGPALDVDAGFDGVVVEDVPDHYALAVRLTGLRLVSVAGGPPATLSLQKDPGPFLVNLIEGSRRTRIEFHDLPDSLDATYDPAGSLSLTGSAPMARITASFDDPAGIGGGRATTGHLLLQDVPASLGLSWGAQGTIAVDAGGARLGLFDLGFTSGPALEVDPGYDGAVLEDLPDHYALAVRLAGIRLIRVTTGAAPYTLTIQKDPGPFLVRLLQGARRILVTVHDLPDSIDATLDPAGALTYTASAPIGEIAAEISDPARVSGRVKRASALLRGVPASLDVSWNAQNGAVSADAKGSTVGLIEFQLTSGPDDRIDPQYDGLLLEDLADRYVVFGRITGLRKVVASPAPDLQIDTTGGRILKVDLSQLKNSKVEYTRATLDHLTPSVRIRSVGKDFYYDASAATNSLSFETNVGDRWKLTVSLSNPLPASVSLCSAPDGYCTGYARRSTAGSVKFVASEHTSLSVFDCMRPLDASCTPSGSPSKYLQVDWRIRTLALDSDPSYGWWGNEGYVFMDTDAQELRGTLASIDGDGGFRAWFPAGFWAQDRYSYWSGWGAFKQKSGSIGCPSGTTLQVRLIGISFDVTGYLC
ncbi:MAG: hypothetical protein HY775_12030 [Acidobacteria bacterium]|nr:hypothetical protein [Acidobacteriota bacterium]